MLSKSLKKLVLRKELSLVTAVLEAMDPKLCVRTLEGEVLLGSPLNRPESAELSAMRSPIVLEGERIGWVSGSPKAATAAQLLSSLACRELEKRTLTQDLLSKYKEITLLFRLAEQIVETLDIHQLAQLVLNEAKQVLPSDGGSLMLLRETTHTLESVAAFGEDGPHRAVYQLGEGLIGHIVASGRGEIINDVLSDPRYLRMGQKRWGAMICVPLKVKERLIGAILLQRAIADNRASHPYSAEDLKVLTTLAAQVASVISVLLNEKQLKESRQNELIFQLSSQIRDSLDLSDILNTAVEKIQAVLRSDRCFFLWYLPKTSPAQSSADASTKFSAQPPSNQQSSSSLISHSATISKRYLTTASEARNPLLPELEGTYTEAQIGTYLFTQISQQQLLEIAHTSKIEDVRLRKFLRQSQCAALLAVPMRTRGGRYGLLGCSSSQPREWESEEIELLKAVTNQLVIAIDQSDLYERSLHAAEVAQEQASQLKQALDQLQRMQLQLVQTEKMSSIGRMVAGIAHEINNPVNFIHGNLDPFGKGVEDILELLALYQKAYPAPSPEIKAAIEDMDLCFLQEDLPRMLSSMASGTRRIQEIVLSLQNFSRLDQADMKQVNLHEGIESTLLLLHHRFKAEQNNKAIALVKNYGSLPCVECYPKQINQVFMNLLTNALDALDTLDTLDGSPPKQPTVTITTSVQANWAEVCIADNGPGIPPEIRPYLFDPFFTTKEIGQGTGLGLSMSYQIVVEQHGGELHCTSQVGQGTQMILKIPVAVPTVPEPDKHTKVTARKKVICPERIVP